MTHVLFVDDDDDLRSAMAQSLTLADLHVVPVADAAGAIRHLDAGFEGVVVTDIRMPGMDGLALMAHILQRDPDLPVLLISGHADVPVAVDALRRGAYDFMEKPYLVDQLVASIRRAAERRALVIENRRLRETATDVDEQTLIGTSPAMLHLRRTIAQVGPVDVDVLIQGETGTGKGLVAAMLHTLSRRRGPMVTIDCGALPAGLFEAEVFGHASQAGVGSAMPRTGRIEQAHRGTLFLDEVEALNDQVQPMMQRVLERREVTPLGATRPRALDLRVVTASSSDLERIAQAGQFRASLFYRLNGVTLRLPPLRERPQDIVPMFRLFAVRAAERLGLPPPKLDARTFRHLERHEWPGNVRELMRFSENVALGLTDSDPLTKPDAPQGDLKSRVDLFETQLLEEALAAAGGDVSRTCQSLNLPRKTFYYKAQRLGIDVAKFRG